MIEQTARSGRREPATDRGGAAALGTPLDVLRVVGTFAVLMYHAALSYLTQPMRLTLWHLYDPASHVSMDLVALWVNGFAMPLFFLAAGASAPAAIESRGVGAFLRHRAGRLLRPLLFGVVAILPVTYLLYGYGLLATGRCSLNHISSWQFPPEVERHLYGLAHLWFLEYLFVVCVLWGALWRASRRVGERPRGIAWSWIDERLNSAWSPALLAIPTALVFLADTDTVLRVENDVIPNPSRLVHYLYFFAAGGWLARSPGAVGRLSRHGWRWLALAGVVFVAMSPLLLRLAAAPLTGAWRWTFVPLAACFPWLMILGGLGACRRSFPGKGPTLRFLGEASFWVYIIHLPVVLAMQIALLPLAWPAPVKFMATTLAAVAVSLTSYQYAVRYSLVGEVVNGARKRLKSPGRLGPEFGWAASMAAVAIVWVVFFWQIRAFVWGDNLHEVIPGQLYRSARLSATEFDDVLRRHGVRTVVTFTGTAHGWLDRQRTIAGMHGATIRTLNLRDDREPSRAVLEELLDALQESPRPILIQGYRGLDHCGLAAALARMLQGASPESALDQFSIRYAQFGGAEHSVLGGVLLDYRTWLEAQRVSHSPGRLRRWVTEAYRPDTSRRGASVIATRPADRTAR